ncbi:MAG: peptidylprolyl isomerase [Actinobacteria bacterium]|nr:peptidylprolyl isomerase [Actinomycetota bacterium]
MTRKLFVSACLIAAALAACGGDDSGGSLAPAAATVGDERITTDEVNQEVDNFKGTAEFDRLAEQQDAESLTRQFEQATLARLIRRAVITPEAEQLGVEVGADEIDQRIEQIKGQLPDEAAFQKALDERGLTLGDVEQLVRDQLLEEKLRTEVTADAGPAEEEIRRIYEDNPQRFTETHMQHILIESADDALANKLSKQLQAAPEAKLDSLFSDLAKKYSIDPAAKQNGGDLGFQADGQLVAQLEDAADKLDIGEVSQPVQSEFGLHIIWVLERRKQSFEQAKATLQQELAASGGEEAWQDFLVEAYKNADVEVNPKYGELDLSTQTIVNASDKDTPGAEAPDEGSGG